MPLELALLAPTRCTGREEEPGRLVGPSQARAGASVRLRVAGLQPSQPPIPRGLEGGTGWTPAKCSVLLGWEQVTSRCSGPSWACGV